MTHKVVNKKSGKTYFYAWRGGPRIADPSTPEGAEQLRQLTDDRAKPYVQNIGHIVAAFRKSPGFRSLRPNTRRSYEQAMDKILAEFETTPASWIDKRGARGMFLQWRDEMASHPAAADQTLMVLRSILSWALDRELVTVNPLLRYKRLNKSSRRDVVWSAEQMAVVMDKFPKRLVEAFRLALLTGQRQGDLLKLRWSQIGQTIQIEQEKTGARVAIPVQGELASLLASLDRKSVYVLTNSQGRPWTSNGFASAWYHACKKHGITGVHYHDLRGTAVCRWYSEGWSLSDIAAMTGHSEVGAERILRQAYMPRHAAVLRMTAKPPQNSGASD